MVQRVLTLSFVGPLWGGSTADEASDGGRGGGDANYNIYLHPARDARDPPHKGEGKIPS